MQAPRGQEQQAMSDEQVRQPATVDALRLGTGFAESERDAIVERFRKLDRRLARYEAGTVDMELSVKNRDGKEQSVVLECWVAGKDRFVATSRERRLDDALLDVREDLWRQIDDRVNRKTPKTSRRARGSGGGGF
jgi:hypothetical protein